MGVKAQNQVTIIDITDAYSVILSNENQTFREVSLNGGTAAQTVDTTVYSYRGSTNVYSYFVPDPNVSQGKHYLNADGVWLSIESPNTNPAQDLIVTIHIPSGLTSNGTINIPIELYETSTTGGEPLTEFTKTFSYSVARYGSTGAAATIYELEYTGNLFNFDNETGSFLSPTSITVTASSQEGTNAKQAYTGGTITVTPYTATGTAGSSSSHSTTVTITPTATLGEPDYLYYIATLTVGGNIVDRQTIGMNRQGANGENAYAIDITSSNGLVFKNADIATTLTAHVYSGGTELTPYTAVTALGMYINWYNGNTGVGTGATYTISAGDVQSLVTITAKLEDTQWSSNS